MNSTTTYTTRGDIPDPPSTDLHHTSYINDHSSSEVDNTDYPEGGVQAWGVVFGSWAGLIAAFGIMNSTGVFQAYISEVPLRDYSEGAVGWIFGIYLFLCFFCTVLFGPIFDAHGPRWLVLLGSILLVASMMLLSVCTEYLHFLLTFAVLGGVGSSLMFIPAFTAPGHFFLRKRGMATGIAATGGSVGGVTFPLVLDVLIPRIGFAWATRVLGFIILFLVAIANVLIRSRVRAAPSSLSSSPAVKWSWFKLDIKLDWRIFLDPAFSFIAAGVLLMELGYFIPITYISSYSIQAVEKGTGMTTSLAYQLLSIVGGTSFFGRWVSGLVADHIGRFNTLIICNLLCLVSTAALWLPAAVLSQAGVTVPLMIAYAAVFGFASGSNISVTPVCVGQLCKTEDYGRYYATCYVVASFGPLIGIPLVGQILTANGGEYWGLITCAVAVYFGSLVMISISRGLASNWKITTVF